MSGFALIVTLTDGFRVELEQTYRTQEAAERAASVYIRDYSDPCGLGVAVDQIAIVDLEARRRQSAA